MIQVSNDWTLKITKVPERFSNDIIGDYLPLFNKNQPDRFLGFYKVGSYPPATCTELNGEGEIGGQCIGLLCKELLLPDDVFRNLKVPGLFMEDHLSGHYAPEVSELVEEIDEIITRLMNAGQYKELIHDKKAGTYTAEELQSLKQILLDYEDAAKQAYGEASSTTFAYLIDFFKCKDVPNICSTDGVLPHCWWQFTLNGNTAFSAGIFDGIGELLALAVDLNRFSNCWLSASGYLWDTDNSCAATRQSTMEAVKFTWELSSGNPEAIAQVALISALAGDKIWDDLGIWANETGLCTNRPEVCCAYSKGKLAFDIASLFVGAGEFKVAGKISGLGAKTLQMMTSLIGGLGKTKFPGKVLSLQAIRNTAGKGLSHLMLMASLSGNPTAVATGVRVLANEAKTTTTWVATTAGRIADNSTTVLARAIEQSADNAGAKLVAEVDEIILLLDDVPQNLNKLNAFQVADNIVFAKETTNGLEAIFAFTAAGLVKIPPKDNNSVECEFCSPSKSLSKRLCDKLEQLKTKGGANGATGVQKLCSSLSNAQLETIADELLLAKYSIAEVTAFMEDIAEASCGGAPYLCGNVSGLTVSVIEAWKLVFDAKGTLNYKKDFKLLQQVASIQANGTLMQTLGGESVLTDVIRKNENAPCNTCQNNKTWLNDMTEYLKDVTYFVNTFGKNTGGNRSAMVFSSGITSGNKGHVIGAVYMLKVLRKDPSIRPSSFEGALKGPLANCEPDAVSGNKIYEFKSWSPNTGDTDIGSMGDDEDYATIGGSSAFLKLANNSYASSPNSYTQFVCYLSNASSIADLEYVFDKDLLNAKGQNNAEAYVKNMFRELLLKPQEQQQIFNAIWGNAGLRGSLFGNRLEPAAKVYFTSTLVNDINSILYNFIKVK